MSTVPPYGVPHRVDDLRARMALARRVLENRPACPETIELAMRALLGEDLIATGENVGAL